MKHRCNHMGCWACGFDDARKWLNQHRLKGLVIGDPTLDFLLTWPDLPTYSKSVDSAIKFFAAIRTLVAALKDRACGQLDGLMLATQINAMPNGGWGQYQLHAHASALPGKSDPRQLFEKIAVLWRQLGGKASMREGGDARGLHASGLLGFMDYVCGDPCQGFKPDERLSLHNNVLNALELRLKTPAVVRVVGGPALSPNGFLMLRAKARYLDRVSSGEWSFHQKATDPYLKSIPHCPGTVRELSAVEVCPFCNCYGNVARSGRIGMMRRHHCRACGNHWPDRAVLAGRQAAEETQRRRGRIMRYVAAWGSAAAVAKGLYIPIEEVRTAIAYSQSPAVRQVRAPLPRRRQRRQWDRPSKRLDWGDMDHVLAAARDDAGPPLPLPGPRRSKSKPTQQRGGAAGTPRRSPRSGRSRSGLQVGAIDDARPRVFR